MLHVAKRLEYLPLEEWRELDEMRAHASKLTWGLYNSVSRALTA